MSEFSIARFNICSNNVKWQLKIQSFYHQTIKTHKENKPRDFFNTRIEL